MTRSFLIFNGNYIFNTYDVDNDDFTEEFNKPKIELREVGTNKVQWSENSIYPRFYISEKNRQIYYFKNQDWWVYDIASNLTCNLTSTLSDVFFQFNRSNTKVKIPFDDVYFNWDESKLYFTSKRNIWRYDVAKSNFQQLTNNEDETIRCQIVKDNEVRRIIYRLQWQGNPEIDDHYLIFKKIKNNGLLEGLFVLMNGKEKTIENFGINSISKIKSTGKYISYISQNANQPMAINTVDITKAQHKLIFKTNTENYYNSSTVFPKTHLLSWQNKNGLKFSCSVTLPADYDCTKKYPVIINIYENEALKFKEFVYPSLHNQAGFNRTLFAENGYVVILPQINYSVDKPGESALESVTEAINFIEGRFKIDRTRLGIVGHSFGGYEVDYIISHSNIFKAAISGASLADITASYFSLNKNFIRPDYWRYTDQSFRMSHSFFENREIYLENNPIFAADKVNTPVLIWSGKEDFHVDKNQSISFYLALRSLHKIAKLYLIPGEQHLLLMKNNQASATKLFLAWFNYYLK
ncbi:S9 family peptidase [Chryseobacterium sp. NEB161]|nr:S9 family peptidase [Chryseobacterium sp. NEB161]